jgi:hypothetical protein
LSTFIAHYPRVSCSLSASHSHLHHWLCYLGNTKVTAAQFWCRSVLKISRSKSSLSTPNLIKIFFFEFWWWRKPEYTSVRFFMPSCSHHTRPMSQTGPQAEVRWGEVATIMLLTWNILTCNFIIALYEFYS